MSTLSDRPHSPSPNSGARAYARLDTRGPVSRKPEPAPQAQVSETVTLNKIGDFLEIDFGRLFVWLRAGLFSMLLLALIGAGAGAAYAVLSKPKYTVATEILIDPANLQVVADDLYAAPGQAEGQLMSAGSKLRILTSGNVLERVVDELKLVDDTEFYDPTPSFGLSSLFGGGDTAEPNPKLEALGALSKRVGTRADETSFVATLSVSAVTPAKAIRISDAMVRAFQEELANAEAEGASRTAASLTERLSALKDEVKLAEERVESYKRQNGLASSSGELVSAQTMTQLNTQVLQAQSDVIAAESTYNELLAGGREASTGGTQASATLSALRARYTELRQKLDAQSMVYGARHPNIVRLSAELGAVQSELDAEVKRIVEAAKVGLDEAKASLLALTTKAETLKSSVFSDNAALVKLRELERDAGSKATIYEAFLSRAAQVTEREQIDTTNVRVISTAVPPAARSWPPRTVVMLGAGAVGGLLLGAILAVGLGIFRDMRRDRVRNRGAVAAAA